jgi:hypothetical protein
MAVILWAVRDSKPDAGWSSLVARRAHNPKVIGSNPIPATTRKAFLQDCREAFFMQLSAVLARREYFI